MKDATVPGSLLSLLVLAGSGESGRKMGTV